MKFLNNTKINLKLLILLPLSTYLISYFYLAYYHGKFLIFNTVVHEGGKYTLLQDMFYASHFLGHVPMITVLAFLFVGFYLCLTGFSSDKYPKKKNQVLIILIVFLLVFSFFLSLAVFGQEDTFSFLSQQKQGVGIYEEGGAWNLHLPSTVLLFLFIPVFIYTVKRVYGRSIRPNSKGIFYICMGAFFFILLTCLFNKNVIDAFFSIWKNPRYMAHSVRELLTFPLTYFPIALYFFLKGEKSGADYGEGKRSRNRGYMIACLAVFFLIGLFYQSFVSLTEGIENLAQKPGFARGGKLGIPYLLTSHYFEHFLDTIYFTLLCLLLYGFSVNKENKEEYP